VYQQSVSNFAPREDQLVLVNERRPDILSQLIMKDGDAVSHPIEARFRPRPTVGKISSVRALGAVAACFALIFAVQSGFSRDDSKTISLFNGKDLTGWKTIGKGTNIWTVGKAAMDPDAPARVKVIGPGKELINTNRTVNLSSEAVFGDCLVEVEFMVGKSTPGSDVDSNSGVKLMNIYEIQIFDSYGKAAPSKIDCGAIYSETPPTVNACKPPGEWQKLVINFRAPRFDESGKKTANAKFVKVTLNGQIVQDDVEIAHGTNVSRKAPEHPTGPIYLQGDHGSVAFRNIKVTPLN
jgi:hypothetical protein